MYELGSHAELDLIQSCVAQAIGRGEGTIADHPRSEELVCYQEKRLPEAVSYRVRCHLVVCEECARDVLALGKLELDPAVDGLEEAWNQHCAAVREIAAINDGSESPPQSAEHADSVSIEEQIESLYDEIITLSREEPANGSLRDEIERLYARLLELQTAEAELFRERFEASLNMPIDAGDQILARSNALRKELESHAASDPAAQDADSPQALAKAL